jgi:Stage II sporulation protein E (SpoIIE)
MRKLAFLFLLAGPLTASAQSLITVPAQQCVWHAGDNPAWAAPSLDDSAWQPYSSWKLDTHTPRITVRCHASLAPLRALSHPALQVHFHGASAVYLNGTLIASSGNLPSGQYSLDDSYTAALSPASLSNSGAILALRITLREIAQTEPAEILLGDEQALRDRHAAAALSGVIGYLPVALCFSLIGVVGFMLLGLWVTDRTRLELLLLAILCWMLCDLRLAELCLHALVPLPSQLYSVAYGAGQFLLVIWIWFIFRIAGKRAPWFYWISSSVVTFFFSVSLFAYAILPPALNLRVDALYNQLSAYFFAGALACVTAPLAAFWPWNRVPRRLRSVAFFCAAWGAADFLWFLCWELDIVGWMTGAHAAHLRKYLLILRATTTLCSVLALLTIFFREQRRIAQDRALLAGEMQAAREIQTMLAPAVLEAVPGLRVDVAFHPMRDVGGDFYLCRPLADGRQRILVGDVSGKGTAAAMTATLLIGAAERRAADTPAQLLSHLNLVLRDSRVGGFATCLCADLAPNGTVTIANAGHLAPYCRGEEIPVVSSLPLGLNEATDAVYEESHFPLAPGATLTFISDGVVEARSAAGELYGFERTAAISTRTAEEIAHAASTHGQQDDITVLTLTYAPATAGVIHA